MAKEKKPRADKYEEKLAINGSFADVIKASVNYTPPQKKAAKMKLGRLTVQEIIDQAKNQLPAIDIQPDGLTQNFEVVEKPKDEDAVKHTVTFEINGGKWKLLKVNGRDESNRTPPQ